MESTPLTSREARRLARSGLPPEVWRYLERRAGGYFTDRNEAAWAELSLRPRIFQGVEAVDVAASVLGRHLAFPVMTAPNGRATRYHPDGEAALLCGAARSGIGSVLPSSVGHTLDSLVAAVDLPNVVWGQVYLGRDEGRTAAHVDAIARSGGHAVVVTVDLVPGQETVAPPPPAPASWEQGEAATNSPLYASADLNDLEALVRRSPLPVVVKGVLTGDDARACVQAGAKALVVSNHGDAQLRGALTTARALPDVRAAVGPDIDVLVDGGIRNGSDIVRALAMGASSVLVGRPISHSLAVNGADGVADLLAWLKADLERTMALCGCRRLADIGEGLIDQR